MNSKANFNFSFKIDENIIELNESIEISDNLNIEEFSLKLIKKYKIPIYSRKKFSKKLKNFIIIEEEKKNLEKIIYLQEEFHDNLYENKSRILLLLNKLSSIATKKEEFAIENGAKIEISKDFCYKYHTLLHSGFLTEPLIKLEHSFAFTILNLFVNQNKEIAKLKERQLIELEIKLKTINDINENSLNLLKDQHLKQIDDLNIYWDKKIKECKKHQKRDFFDWINNIIEDLKEDKQIDILNCIQTLIDATYQNVSYEKEYELFKIINKEFLEESFTINLGSQLKTTHNLRLNALDLLDLCKNDITSNSIISPHRIHTSMLLYSNCLSALILISDKKLSNFDNVRQNFAKLCDMSIDFHFPDLNEQIYEVKQEAKNWYYELEDDINLDDIELENGDFFVTKHSNLSRVHVIFHLVSNETVFSSEINSRNPILAGLRNVLKTAHSNNVNTIFIPLFLINEVNESITLQWCNKRAELVFKCVKGFMIEISSLAASIEENNLKNIQFLVPTTLSQELFQSLASMLSSIFKMSNPLTFNDMNLSLKRINEN